MKPIKLRIRKKVRVPTKNAIVHQFRSDWKLVGVIEYAQSTMLFKCLGGKIETDAQFAKLIFDNYGSGIYSVIGWKKGHEGFFSFGMWEVHEDGFARLKKNKTNEDNENEKIRRKLRELKKQSDKIPTEELQEEIEELKEDVDLNKMIKEAEPKKGPSPYLKQTQPLYRMHSYQSSELSRNKSEVEASSLW